MALLFVLVVLVLLANALALYQGVALPLLAVLEISNAIAAFGDLAS
jgi:hypothetical protein